MILTIDMKKTCRYAFILDKDEFVRLSLNRILQKYGFQVEEVDDFSQLRDRRKEIDQGLVLADVEMDMLEKGISLLKKSMDRFVLMSPQITDELKLRLKKMGVHRMIKKPVEPGILKKVIREICPAQEACYFSQGGGREKGCRSIQKGGEST